MNARNLLTKEERHFLSNEANSPDKKIDYLIDILPCKQRGWWDELICCLGDSTEGTAHEYLASKLANQLKRDVHEWQDMHHTDSPSRQNVASTTSVVTTTGISRAVPSGIALDMHSLVPDVHEVEPDNDQLVAAAAKRQKLLTQTSVDTAIDSYKTVMENQIGLVSATEMVL